MTDSGDTLHRTDNPRPLRRRSAIARTWRMLTSPSAAFLLLFPTIGYYSLATYSNLLFGEDGSRGGILIRAGSLAILLIAYFTIPYKNRRGLSIYLLPATLFVFIYSFRLADNMLFLGLDITPGNVLILTSFFLSSLMAAYLLAFSERAIRDEDMIPLLSLFTVLFLGGMALNWEGLTGTAEVRLSLEKINPISMAYTASSLLLFYMLVFLRSPRLLTEALVFVPFLLVIASLSRSRGMLIATGLTILIYVLVLRGTKKVWAALGLTVAAVAVGAWGSEYVSHSLQALQRIDAQVDQSTWERTVYFRGAWEQFVADPLLGRYVNEQTLDGYPHNIYLESLMAVGVVGAAPFLLHVALAWRAALGLLRRRHASFVNAFVALLFIRESIGVAASGALWGVSGFWITSFLVIVMWYGRDRRPVPASASAKEG